MKDITVLIQVSDSIACEVFCFPSCFNSYIIRNWCINIKFFASFLVIPTIKDVSISCWCWDSCNISLRYSNTSVFLTIMINQCYCFVWCFPYTIQHQIRCRHSIELIWVPYTLNIVVPIKCAFRIHIIRAFRCKIIFFRIYVFLKTDA